MMGLTATRPAPSPTRSTWTRPSTGWSRRGTSGGPTSTWESTGEGIRLIHNDYSSKSSFLFSLATDSSSSLRSWRRGEWRRRHGGPGLPSWWPASHPCYREGGLLPRKSPEHPVCCGEASPVWDFEESITSLPHPWRLQSHQRPYRYS